MKKVAAVILFSFLFVICLDAQTNSEMDPEQAYQSALKAYDAAVMQMERSNVRSQKRAIIKKTLSLNDKQSAQSGLSMTNMKRQQQKSTIRA